MKKWTSQDIDQIRKLKKEGLGDAEIANKLNTTRIAISNLVSRYRLILPHKVLKAKQGDTFRRMWETRREELIKIHQRPQFWTSERKEKLTELINSGSYTHSKVAEVIGCSKNAVSMVAWRLGISSPESVRSSATQSANIERWRKKYLAMRGKLEKKMSTLEMGYIIAVTSSTERYVPRIPATVTVSSKDMPFLKFFLKAFAKVTGKELNIKRYAGFNPQISICGYPILNTIVWRSRVRSNYYFFHLYRKNFWRGFLQGLFDARGSVHPDKRLWQIRLVAPEGELPLLRLVRKLLRRYFDIKNARFNFRIGGLEQIALTISGGLGDFKKFQNEIGFRHNEKNKALKRLIEKYKNSSE